VYSQLSDLPVMSLVEDVLDATGAAFVLHVMDDWPATMYRGGAFSLVPRRRAMAAFRRLLARASSRMAIGEAMAREYERRYGETFIGIQNPTDLASRDALAARYASEYRGDNGGRLVVLYAGRIGTANAASLELVAHAVSEMAESGAGIVLRIHTPNADHPGVVRMGALRGVSDLPPVTYERMPALLDSADVLLLPLDFDREAMRFAGLSMPTKIPEYLAAARPVLTVAPRKSAAGDYASTGGWSLLVDEPDRAAVRTALGRLMAEPSLRASMGRAGRLLAQRDHDARAVRERFARELRRAAETAGR
jgi:glycosyltransferase involved in cell wall biosynthesis